MLSGVESCRLKRGIFLAPQKYTSREWTDGSIIVLKLLPERL